jgi:hypothetical protein
MSFACSKRYSAMYSTGSSGMKEQVSRSPAVRIGTTLDWR